MTASRRSCSTSPPSDIGRTDPRTPCEASAGPFFVGPDRRQAHVFNGPGSPRGRPLGRLGAGRGRRGVPGHGQQVGVRAHRDPPLPVGNPACLSGEAGRRRECLQGRRALRGELGDGIRQHVVRLDRHDAGVRTEHDPGTEPVQASERLVYGLHAPGDLGGRTSGESPGTTPIVTLTKTSLPARAASRAGSASTPSAVTNVACSMLSTPAASASLIAGVPCAWAATGRPSRCASSTTARRSADEYCDSCGGEPGVMLPPLNMILTTAQPRSCRSRTAARRAAAPSAAPPMKWQ